MSNLRLNDLIATEAATTATGVIAQVKNGDIISDAEYHGISFFQADLSGGVFPQAKFFEFSN